MMKKISNKQKLNNLKELKKNKNKKKFNQLLKIKKILTSSNHSNHINLFKKMMIITPLPMKK